MPQEIHFSLILLAIVHPDGDQTIFSRALLDADFGPLLLVCLLFTDEDVSIMSLFGVAALMMIV